MNIWNAPNVSHKTRYAHAGTIAPTKEECSEETHTSIDRPTSMEKLNVTIAKLVNYGMVTEFLGDTKHRAFISQDVK